MNFLLSMPGVSNSNYKIHVQTITWKEYEADALKSDGELEREEVEPLFDPVYEKDTKRMKALIGTLSEEKRRGFVAICETYPMAPLSHSQVIPQPNISQFPSIVLLPQSPAISLAGYSHALPRFQ
ncbi:hypothetical protein niasHT_017752 [Heterodera trifolii]|uniref:Uncharacterized protein n=1 Tax=Heterodera trifolii TaxID=157864 RepID=A0ABD2LJE8_9BILA